MPVRRHRPRVEAIEEPPRSRAGRMGAVLAGLGVVLGVEVLLFGDDVTRNLQTLLTQSAQARAEGPRPLAPIPVVAPPEAGPVAQIELRPLDTCKAGASCTVLLQVGLQAQPRPVAVAWELEVFDRCGPTRQRQVGGPVTVPAGQDRMVQTMPLDLPAGKAMAVVPVVTQPARAAGRPMEPPRAADTC